LEHLTLCSQSSSQQMAIEVVHMYNITRPGSTVSWIRSEFRTSSSEVARRQITRLQSVNGGIRKDGMSKHWTAAKFMQPRREEALVAFQRLARTKVSNTGVAVSSQPLTNDVSEPGGSKRRIQVGGRRSNRRRAFEAAFPPLARAKLDHATRSSYAKRKWRTANFFLLQ